MTNSTKGKSLTLELVFNKTKSDNLNNIKNLNLWGNELEDLQLIEKMPNLEVISLSVNKINSLKDFAKCAKLHVFLTTSRNSTFAKTASLISSKSDTSSTFPISNHCGSMITPVLSIRNIEK